MIRTFFSYSGQIRTFILVTGMIFVGCKDQNTKNSLSKVGQDTLALTRDWEKPIPNQRVPKGLNTIRAQECGTCHTDIYREWKRSIHSIAYQDPQFQSEWKKDGVYVCLNCHTPLQNQQEFIVTGLVGGDHRYPATIRNSQYDEILKMESITCATCHVRDGNIIGAKGYPDSVHSVRVDPSFLSEQICIGCHNVSDELDPSLVCTFETGDEWSATSKREEGFNCITCHMPLINRQISDEGTAHESHRHHFPGSGFPKFANLPVDGLQGLKIYDDKPANKFNIGDTMHYSINLENSYAGHSLPTGDPERFYLVRFLLQDVDDRIVREASYRIGEEWQWYPVALKISDNNIRSGENRVFHFDQSWAELGRYTFKVLVTKHRITEENAKFNQLPSDYPRQITIFNRDYQITVGEID